MSAPIHGHQVLRMMVESGQSYTTDSLRDAIVQRFGADARFYTCSAENLTADELIAFLDQRGKFITKDDAFVTDVSRICADDS